MSTDLTYSTPSGKFIETRTLVDKTGVPLSDINSLSMGIKFGDSESVDAFSRARVSQLQHKFENKNVLIRNAYDWHEVTNGAGTISSNTNESCVDLSVGTASGDSAVRQSATTNSYLPGKSQLIIQTFVLAPPQTNLRQRIGYFNRYNGLFFESANTSDISFVVRTSTGGSVVDNKIPRSSWNLDKLDGTGPSGLTLDLTKIQIFIMDFQWLGAGRVRYGFDIGGNIVYCHEQNHSNVLSTVYMTIPTLPIRYEIENTGATSSASTLKEVCSTVASEGGHEQPGTEFDVDSGITLLNTSTTETHMMSIRLKKRINSLPNVAGARLTGLSSYNSGAETLYKAYHIHAQSYDMTIGTVTGGPFQVGETITDGTTGATATVTVVGTGVLSYVETNEFYFGAGNTITGSVSGATATISTVTDWISVSPYSFVEYAILPIGLTPSESFQIGSAMMPSVAGNRGLSNNLSVSALNKNSTIYQDYDSVNSQVFSITSQNTSGAGTSWVSMRFLETV